MNKSLYFLLLLFVALSCQCKEEPNPQNWVEAYPEYSVFHVDSARDADAKAAIQSNGRSVWWQPEDAIKVFSGNSSGVFEAQLTEPQPTADFVGTFNPVTDNPETYYAVYPASSAISCENGAFTVSIPSEQIAVAGSFDRSAFISFAVSDTHELQFKNVTGGIKFSVTRSDITKIVVSSTNRTNIAGTVEMSINASGVPIIKKIISSARQVALLAPAGESFVPGSFYYISLLPVTLSGGLRFEYHTSSGAIGLFYTSSAPKVKPSVFGVLEEVDTHTIYCTEDIVAPDVVDLGLPSGVKWGNRNIGAQNVEESGYYFAFGEILPKTRYTLGSYSWCDGAYNKLTKYNSNASYGVVDGKTELDEEDDVASAILGGRWRIPSTQDFWDLYYGDYCTWTWTAVRGVSGYIVRSKTTNNAIFLPVTGQFKDASITDATTKAYYWSSDASSGCDAAAAYFWDSGFVYNSGMSRSLGLCVRPVWDESLRYIIHPDQITLDKSNIELYRETSPQSSLEATVLPDNSSDKSVVWTSSDESIVTVSANGEITAIKRGTATVTATTVDGGLTASCSVTVRYPEPDAVDLGLPSGVKWGSFNLGADSSSANGIVYAWGEVKGFSSIPYNKYTWLDKNENLLKYNTSAKYGVVDNKCVLDIEDDIARKELGKAWRLPTKEELEELLNPTYCKWTWIHYAGFFGYEVKSRTNNNSIMIRMSGSCRGQYYFSDYYTDGYYWTSALSPENPKMAYCLHFTESEYELTVSHRNTGLFIRPVTH